MGRVWICREVKCVLQDCRGVSVGKVEEQEGNTLLKGCYALGC